MPEFRKRSDQKEMLDEYISDRKLLFKNFHELNILNRLTGGHRISLEGINKLISDPHRTYHIADLGCGSGDSLKKMASYARKRNLNVRLTGIDKSFHAIDFLKTHCRAFDEITGVCSDYSDFLANENSPDIIHCSLFCHHLSEKELLGLLEYCRENVSCGLIINDLHRTAFAYYCARFFTRVLHGSVLARNDGPVSVLRGFKYAELEALLKKAGIADYRIQSKWPFRFLVIAKTGKDGGSINQIN